MFRLQRLEISGFKSFADHTEIVFTGNGITAVVGPNGCGKSNVSDAISWVLGEQRAKSLRGGEMKDVVFAGTRSRKPGGMAEVVLHMVRDDSVELSDESELENIDSALGEIDEFAVDMDAIEGVEAEPEQTLIAEVDSAESETAAQNTTVDAIGDAIETIDGAEIETVKAAQVGSIQTVEKRVKTKRHWRPRTFALDFAPGEAIAVTRRLYLSGESEYELNGKTCRLRDIQDLFAGTGLSGSHYAIIEQGRIGQILSSKPADRRNLIEEAAGISKFRMRQRAAESRLDTARANLSRITDIVAEVEKQVNSLRRQAAKTRRFKILQEEYREMSRQLYAAEGRYFASLSEQLEKQLIEAVTAENTARELVTQKEESARESTQNARQVEESLAELRQLHAQTALERDRVERDYGYKSEQILNLNGRIEILKNEIASAEERLRSLGDENEKLEADEAAENASVENADGELRLAEEAYAAASGGVASVETRAEAVRVELIQHTAAAERFDELASQLGIALEKSKQRFEGLGAERERAVRTHAEHEEQAKQISETLKSEEEKLSGLDKERADLIATSNTAREVLRSAEAELDRLSDEHSARHHRLATLKELEEERAVYTPQVQKLFAARSTIGVELKGVLADHLNVEQRAEAAVEALFGNFLEAVIVPTLDDARRVSVWLNENGIGRTAMLIADPGVPVLSREESVSDRIGDLLGASPELTSALSEIFPREVSAILVDDLDGNSTPGVLRVNSDGEMLIGGRMYIAGRGTSEGKNESLLAFKREVRELENSVAAIEIDITSARKSVDVAGTALVELESKMVDLQSLIIKVDRGIHGLQIQLSSAKDEIERAIRHKNVVTAEAQQIESEIAELSERLSDSESNKVAATTALTQVSKTIEQIQSELSAARSRADEASIILSEKRTVSATSAERQRSVRSAIRRIAVETEEIRSRLALQRNEIAEAEEKVLSLQTSITEISGKMEGASTEIDIEQAALATAISSLAEARVKADSESQELADLNRSATEAQAHRSEIDVRRAETSTRLENLAEACHHEMNLTLDQLVETVELPEDFDLEFSRTNGEDLRRRLEGFGAINMLALDELAEAEERNLFLSTQHQDVVQSIAATEEALREIKTRSRERFRSAFEAINENFSEFFQQLFGGGQGQMSLLEADDILEAGIEVVAQPPGKRLQNILLLSGGEKAMTAIALVMAIFKYRPAPFCLLDEVDAPLDDANVGRFVNKIAEMAEKTQFLVITHNKRTMEAAKALYGVTMQEPGVSKIVSVRFE